MRELFGANEPLGHREVVEDWGSRVCSRVVSRCRSLQAAPGHSKESCFGSEPEGDLAEDASVSRAKSDVQPEDGSGSPWTSEGDPSA